MPGHPNQPADSIFLTWVLWGEAGKFEQVLLSFTINISNGGRLDFNLLN